MLATLALVTTLLAPAGDGWLRPVPGRTARAFDYREGRPFASGQHRGADLTAPAGYPVRSACAGEVVFAGRTPGHGRVVSVRCGRRRVAYLPLRGIRVRRGASIGRGDRLGRVAAGHGGALHVGVREEGRRFAYRDPLALFGAAAAPPPVIPRTGPPPRRAPRGPSAVRVRVPAPKPVAAPTPTPAPWPVWLGFTLLLLGGAGTTTLRTRRRSARVRRKVVSHG